MVIFIERPLILSFELGWANLRFDFFFSPSFLNYCVCAHTQACSMVFGGMEGHSLEELVLSFYSVGPKDQTPVI